MAGENPKPLFEASCTDSPTILNVSFASDPRAPLGAELVNRDQGEAKEMFLPGYAVVGRLLGGQTIARKFGVQVGDCIVAVNGQGIRRFPLDYDEDEAEVIAGEDEIGSDHQVVPQGGAYDVLLAKIKHIKANGPDPPLVISFERYGWDARANSWPRFLVAREGNVPAAMQLIQDHEAWKAVTFPIDLTSPGLQKIFKDKVISIMDVGMGKGHPPTIYVNYAKLQQMQHDNWATLGDIIHGFVVFTEMILSKLSDPRNPKTNQFIDLSNVTITSGFRVDTLKAINQVFERNYPETLNKMVLYPVSSMVGMTARSLLGFVEERTQHKLVITNSLDSLCDALGWKNDMVEGAGGLPEFVEKYERVDYASMLFFNSGIAGDETTDGGMSISVDSRGPSTSAAFGGGHAIQPAVIQGHLKGIGVVLDRWTEEDDEHDNDEEEAIVSLKIRITHDLLKYLVPNGLVFLDGVSLPVANVKSGEGWFCIHMDKFAQEQSGLACKEVGSEVGVQVDILGKYWENDLSKIMSRLESLEAKVISLEEQLAKANAKNSPPTENGDVSSKEAAVIEGEGQGGTGEDGDESGSMMSEKLDD